MSEGHGKYFKSGYVCKACLMAALNENKTWWSIENHKATALYARVPKETDSCGRGIGKASLFKFSGYVLCHEHGAAEAISMAEAETLLDSLPRSKYEEKYRIERCKAVLSRNNITLKSYNGVNLEA